MNFILGLVIAKDSISGYGAFSFNSQSVSLLQAYLLLELLSSSLLAETGSKYPLVFICSWDFQDEFKHTGCLRQSAIFSWHVTGAKPHQILLINDSFSSQTWTIFLPNRNFYVKSIWCPTRPLRVRSQNQGNAQYLIKIKRKIRNFPKTGPNSLNFLIKIMFIELLGF